jgi:hypothetical protein
MILMLLLFILGNVPKWEHTIESVLSFHNLTVPYTSLDLKITSYRSQYDKMMKGKSLLVYCVFYDNKMKNPKNITLVMRVLPFNHRTMVERRIQ